MRISPPGRAHTGSMESIWGLPFTFFAPVFRSIICRSRSYLVRRRAFASAHESKVKQQLQDNQAVNACAKIVHHNSRALRQPFQAAHRRRLNNIEARKSIKPASSACHTMGHAIRVSSCPATSSITTCDGSFLPHPRASSVAAGMPIAATTTISSTITGIRADGGRCEANSHHNKTVASEPHVPGPGRNRPAPKNVATSVAQRGAGGPVSPGSLWLFASLVRVVGIVGLRIVQRGGDDIAAARPLAQVNRAAVFAAERKLGIVGQHDLSASWTT